MSAPTTEYTKMTRQQLTAALQERGLPASGTNAEMVTRLEIADDPSRAFDPDMAPSPDTAPPAPAVQTAPVSVQPPTNPHLPTVQCLGHIVVVTHPCAGELSTGMHEMFVKLTYDLATSQGHTPRGGLNGANAAHCTGFVHVAGVRHARYEIPIVKQQ